MENVRVNKEKVLDRLRENRGKHREFYLKAVEGWREQASVRLATIAEELKKGKIPSLFINLEPPVDYTSEYDTAIDMLEMSVATDVELSFNDFKAFVRDDWRWKREFLASNSVYYSE